MRIVQLVYIAAEYTVSSRPWNILSSRWSQLFNLSSLSLCFNALKLKLKVIVSATVYLVTNRVIHHDDAPSRLEMQPIIQHHMPLELSFPFCQHNESEIHTFSLEYAKQGGEVTSKAIFFLKIEELHTFTSITTNNDQICLIPLRFSWSRSFVFSAISLTLQSVCLGKIYSVTNIVFLGVSDIHRFKM